MFKDVLDYTDGLLKGAESSQDFLYKLHGDRRRLINRITKAQKLARDIETGRNYVAELKKAFKSPSIKLAKKMLMDETINALKKRQEFDIPLYRIPLYEAIMDDDTYLYRPTGTGFNSIIKIDIDLNRTAGRLNFWASAVKRTRNQLKVKIPSKYSTKAKREKAALAASRAWAGIYNRRGVGGANSKYMKTIRMRMQNAAKPGSFWELLDKGSVPMASDRGGYPTPENTNLGFVGKTEIKVNEQLKDVISKEQEKAVLLRQDALAFIEAAQLALDDVASMIYQIRLNVNFIRRVRKAYDQKLVNAVNVLDKAENSLKRTKDFRAGSLERAVENILAGRPGTILVDVEEGRIFIHDGRHTLEAYKKLDIKNPPFVLRSDDGSL